MRPGGGFARAPDPRALCSAQSARGAKLGARGLAPLAPAHLHLLLRLPPLPPIPLPSAELCKAPAERADRRAHSLVWPSALHPGL
jgi:hypothetical protein